MSEKKEAAVQKQDQDEAIVKKSKLFIRLQDEGKEIQRHKWLESEKEGNDIGKDRALIDWIIHHRCEWEKKYNGKSGPERAE